jgi:hypothetical protein
MIGKRNFHDRQLVLSWVFIILIYLVALLYILWQG